MNQLNEGNSTTPSPKSFISSTPLWLLIISSNLVSIFASVGLSFVLFNQVTPNSKNLKNEQITALKEYNKKLKEENETYVNKQITDFSIQLDKKLNDQNNLLKDHDSYIRNYLKRIRQLEEKTIPPINFKNKDQSYEIGYGFLIIPRSIEEFSKENKVNLKIKVINTSGINYENLILNLKVGQQPEVLLATSSGSNAFNLRPGYETILEATISNVLFKDLETAQVAFKVPPAPLPR